jgi:hypothetical protein
VRHGHFSAFAENPAAPSKAVIQQDKGGQRDKRLALAE